LNKPVLTTLLCMGILLAGCSSVEDVFKKKKEPLEGERISILELQRTLEPDDAVLESQGLITPEPWRNQFWPQAGGYPNHSMHNLVLDTNSLKKIWSADIGKGSTARIPLTAQPIVVDGQVFTLDTDSSLTGFNAENGKRLWRTDVMDRREDDTVISGGIAYADGFVYVTNGYNEILSVDSKTGQIAWRVDLPAPSRAAPTILDGRIFVNTLDGKLLTLSATDGTVLWEYAGISETAGLIGAASPAANRQIVVSAFSSGEITALRVQNGSVAWSDNLSNVRTLGGLSSLSDIRALPLIDKGLVVAISFGGRLVAIDERSGARVWQREIGGSDTPWVAGNHLYVISSENELIALGRDTGSVRWITQLPKYIGDESATWSGPIFAGGNLIVAGTDGQVVQIDPETGSVTREWDAGDTISISPVVADATLYILEDNGRLTAYR